MINCTGSEPVTLNVSYFDIDTQNLTVSPDSILVFEFFINGDSREAIFQFTNQPFNEICMEPDIPGVSFLANLTLEAFEAGFVEVTFVQTNGVRSTTTEQVNIFMQNTTAPGIDLQNITVNVVDNNENPLIQALVRVEKFVLAQNDFFLMYEDSTDISGK